VAAIDAMSAKGHERFNVPYLCSEFFLFFSKLFEIL
jgi:hypothetical protein